MTIIFKVKAPGTGSIQFNDVHVLKNDGMGTEDTVQTDPLLLPFAAQGSAYTIQVVDTIPPEQFTPIVTHDPSLYDGKFVVVFATNDKQSGIDHYEVKEGNGEWLQATSPYLLTDQTLGSEINIKAVDLAGNVRIETIEPAHPYSDSLWLLLLGLILFISLLIHHRYVRYHKKKIQYENNIF